MRVPHEGVDLKAEVTDLMESLLTLQRGTGPNSGLTYPEQFVIETLRNLELDRKVVDVEGTEITQVVLLAGKRTAIPGEMRVYICDPEDVQSLQHLLVRTGGEKRDMKMPFTLLVSPIAHADIHHEHGVHRAALAKLDEIKLARVRRNRRR